MISSHRWYGKLVNCRKKKNLFQISFQIELMNKFWNQINSHFKSFFCHTFLLTALVSLGKSCLSSISSRKICFRTVFVAHMLWLLALRTYSRWGRSWKITNYNTVTWISHGVLCYHCIATEVHQLNIYLLSKTVLQQSEAMWRRS